MDSILDVDFYKGNPLEVAKSLIGKDIVRRLDGEILFGTIVEAEAYGGAGDPASHAFRGETRRNSVMFGSPGRAYVYFTYGNHYCLNFVSGRFRGEKAGAVLIRALEPKMGIETMKKLRGTEMILNLTSGPGKICRALGIDLKLNGTDVTDENSSLYVRENESWSGKLHSSSRVGISTAIEKRWRFFDASNPHVSRNLIYPKNR